jgi:glucose/mannose-6-phosphate isomerase
MTVIMLHSCFDHPRNAARFDATASLLRTRDVPFLDVEGRGATTLAQMLSSIYLGDWVSFYLALLYGVDPTPISAIDDLKKQLAQT